MTNDYCKIYFTSKEDLSIIDNNINTSYLDLKNQIFLNKNMDFDKNKESEFPDGFLFFRYTLDFEPEKLEAQECITIISSLLNWFWNNNIPAVASCDYENELVNKGGYNDRAVPFPNTGFQ